MESRIQMYDNVEDMFAAIDKGVQRAKSMILPRQARITYGDYWMRIWEDILIFGRIDTVAELDEEERRLGASEEELTYEHKMMQGSYNNGFRFGRAYSIIEPRGELGDTHVATMVPITKEEFESARDLNWIPEKIIQQDWFFDAVERLRNNAE